MGRDHAYVTRWLASASLAVLAVAAFSGCGGHRSAADLGKAELVTLRASDLGRGWRRLSGLVSRRCPTQATACVDSLFVAKGSADALVRTSVFRTAASATEAYKRTLSALPAIGASLPLNPQVAKLMRRRKEQESTRVLNRAPLTSRGAQATVLVFRMVVSGGPDAVSYVGENVYVVDGRTTTTLHLAPRALVPSASKIVAVIAARTESVAGGS